MDALIYTRDDREYQTLKRILAEEAGVADVHRGDPGTGNQYRHDYDLIIVACDDQTGLRQIRKWKEVNEAIQIIWIAEDDYYMKEAFQFFVFDCFTRPYDESRVRFAIRYVLPRCLNRHHWQFGPARRRTDS